jgi:hypothetical protein
VLTDTLIAVTGVDYHPNQATAILFNAWQTFATRNPDLNIIFFISSKRQSVIQSDIETRYVPPATGFAGRSHAFLLQETYRTAKEKGFRYVIMLDNDAFIPLASIFSLVEAMRVQAIGFVSTHAEVHSPFSTWTQDSLPWNKPYCTKGLLAYDVNYLERALQVVKELAQDNPFISEGLAYSSVCSRLNISDPDICNRTFGRLWGPIRLDLWTIMATMDRQHGVIVGEDGGSLILLTGGLQRFFHKFASFNSVREVSDQVLSEELLSQCLVSISDSPSIVAPFFHIGDVREIEILLGGAGAEYDGRRETLMKKMKRMREKSAPVAILAILHLLAPQTLRPKLSHFASQACEPVGFQRLQDFFAPALIEYME